MNGVARQEVLMISLVDPFDMLMCLWPDRSQRSDHRWPHLRLSVLLSCLGVVLANPDAVTSEFELDAIRPDLVVIDPHAAGHLGPLELVG